MENYGKLRQVTECQEGLRKIAEKWKAKEGWGWVGKAKESYGKLGKATKR